MVDLSNIIRKVANENPLLPYIIKRCDITQGGKLSYFGFKDNIFRINIAEQHMQDELTATLILSHEVSHVMFMANLFTEGFRSNPMFRSQAMDAIINEMLIEYNPFYGPIVEGLKGVTLSGINKHFGTNLMLSTSTWQDVYDVLEQNKQKQQGFDEHYEIEAGNELAAEIIKGIIESNIESDSKLKHSLKSSGELKNFELSQKERQDRKFRSMLAQFLAVVKQNAIVSTLKRPSKRYDNWPKGRTKDKTARCLLAIDISGSMESYLPWTSKTLEVIRASGMAMDVVTFNTGITNKMKNVRLTKLNMVNIGGGTDLDCLAGLEKEYTCMLVISDLECNPPTLDKRKTLLLSHNEPEWKKSYKFYKIG